VHDNSVGSELDTPAIFTLDSFEYSFLSCGDKMEHPVALRLSSFSLLFRPDKSWNKVPRIWFTYLNTKRAEKEDRVPVKGNPWPCVI
jgi:hypothetical protein